jgi:hypothetical protein
MTVLLDAAGRRRSPATMPGYHAGRQPGKKGMQGCDSERADHRRERPALPPGPREASPHTPTSETRALRPFRTVVDGVAAFGFASMR